MPINSRMAALQRQRYGDNATIGPIDNKLAEAWFNHVPMPVQDAVNNVRPALEFAADPLGFAPAGGAAHAVAPLAMRGGKWVRGAERALDTMETGKPFVSNAWRIDTSELADSAEKWWFDSHTTPITKARVAEGSYLLGLEGIGSTGKAEVQLRNPLVIGTNQEDYALSLLKRDGVNLKLLDGKPADKVREVFHDRIAQEALSMGHDGVVFKVGDTVPGKKAGVGAPEIWDLRTHPGVKALRAQRRAK